MWRYVMIFVYSYVTQCHCVSLQNFFKVNGDELTVPIDDDNFKEVNLNHHVPYFNGIYDKIFVNTNGLLSFNRGVPQYIPNAFPLKGELFIAPYWADVDTRGSDGQGQHGGKVFYRESTQPAELQEATEQISEVFELSKNQFNAKFLFIATWDHVGYYSHRVDHTNTFQAVIVSGESHSFVIFNYLTGTEQYPGVQWTFGDASEGKHAQAGFNKGDGKTYVTIPGSNSEDIINIGLASNIDIEGRFIYKIDELEIKPALTKASSGRDGYRENIPPRIVCPERFKIYDVIYNADGQLISDVAKDGLISFVNNLEQLKQMEELDGGKICAVGPFKVGKTWLLKHLCDKQAPDDLILKTRGISVIFSSDDDGDLACIDTEGEHRVEGHEKGKVRKVTDKFHQEIALSICDVILIVIDGLNSYTRDYVDDMFKRISALSSALDTKDVYVIHNFKNFEKKKIVYYWIQDTIKTAYTGEEFRAIGGDGINKWAYYRHKWANDHKPSKHTKKEKLTVNHYVFAKANTSAGIFWNDQTFEELRSMVKYIKKRGNSLDLTKEVTGAFTKILPKYFLAVKNCENDVCKNPIADEQPDADTSKTFYDWTSETIKTWFGWVPVQTSNNVYESQVEISDPDKSPYKVELKSVGNDENVYKLILKNKNEFTFTEYPLTSSGLPLGGYSLSCHSAKYENSITNQKSLIIMCDIPGMNLTKHSDSLQPGQMTVEQEYVNEIRTIVIKGIREKHGDMANETFTTTEKSFSGPFRYDFQIPGGVDSNVIEKEYDRYIGYDRGELRIELPIKSKR